MLVCTCLQNLPLKTLRKLATKLTVEQRRHEEVAEQGSYFATWFLLNPAKAADFNAYLAATYEGSHGLVARHTGGEWRLTVEEMEAARNAMGLDELGCYNIQVCMSTLFL